ncbi:amidohydrolase family protein [Secundilactobacillus paracollinoides]|uniref:amidohydrolase family protein n=1 Tax=Secundilactobacillus paracollinoides TaxID=240427 RepID=UPI003F45527A
MKLVTLEEHWESQQVNEAAKPYLPSWTPQHHNPEDHSIADFAAMSGNTQSAITAAGEDRLKFMDDNGIAMQIMGYGDNTPQNLEPSVAIPLARQANDELTDAIAQHPDRLGGWAVLPVGDPEAAASELMRAVQEKGLQGAMIHGVYNGKFFDDPFYEPIFAMAEQLNVPLYFHPALIPGNISGHYFEGEWSELAAYTFAGAGWGWHEDLGVQMVRLIMDGVFDRHPNLHIITGHWGEMVPNFIERLDQTVGLAVKLDRSILGTYRDNFFITLSGMLYQSQMALTKTIMGADHLMYSIDYPYNQRVGAAAAHFLDEADLTDDERQKIGYQNAVDLLQLDGKLKGEKGND